MPLSPVPPRRRAWRRLACLTTIAAAAAAGCVKVGVSRSAPAPAPAPGKPASATPASATPAAATPAAGVATAPTPTSTPIAAPTAPARPRPYPLFETADFARAVSNGTRTRTGRPGPKYWQQSASYRIDASLDPAGDRLAGHETVTYINNSPDTLRDVAVYLRQNLFAPGAARTGAEPVTGGLALRRVAADGTPVTPAGAIGTTILTNAPHGAEPGSYRVDGTVMWIGLPRPLPPGGGQIELAFDWTFAPPPAPADGREGQDGDVFFLGYWYPQLAVYDDVSGWAADPYLGTAEFYMGYADYDLRLTVPEGWVVGATGTLMNPERVLTRGERDSLARARESGDVVHVVSGDGGRVTAAGTNGRLTWHFAASRVRDVAWATSAHYRWDATRAIVAPGDTVDCYSYFRDTPQAAAWAAGGARFTANAIGFLSGYLWAYPWPQMSSFEGILSAGGMEYPMATVIQSYRDTLSLAGNLMHEVGHMWFPMQVGSNETRYAWMDEGFTQFNSAHGQGAVYGVDRFTPYRAAYDSIARAGHEVPLMTHGDHVPDPALYYPEMYDKTAAVLVALRGLIGDSTFVHAFQEYGRRWTGRHPQPYDFWNTVNEVSGQDLWWFWRSWFYETWTLDQAIAGVTTSGDSTTIVIADRGLVPMPVRLAITRTNGAMQRVDVPVDAWLGGANRHEVRVAASPAVVSVEIDPERVFPDIDRSNQVWTRPR